MTFGNDKLTNLFPPLITLQRKIPKKKIQAEISAGDFTKNFMFQPSGVGQRNAWV